MSLFKRKRYISEKPYELEPGKHYICEIQMSGVDLDQVKDELAALEKDDIHLHVIWGMTGNMVLDMKTTRSVEDA